MMIRCLAPLGPGATVVIVNWDSLAYLRTTIAAVRRFSAGGTRIIVVDNGSHEGRWRGCAPRRWKPSPLAQTSVTAPGSTWVG